MQMKMRSTLAGMVASTFCRTNVVDDQEAFDLCSSTDSNLRCVLQDIKSALSICRDERDAAELNSREVQAHEAQITRDLEVQLSELQQELAARDAVQDELRIAASEHMKELQQAQENVARLDQACSVAEATTKVAQESRIVAVEDVLAAEVRLERMEHDLRLAEEEKQSASTHLAEVKIVLEQSQEDLQRSRQAQTLAEGNHHQASDQLVVLERLVEESQSHNIQLASDYDASVQQVAELARTTEALQEEVNTAGARVAELEADATVQREALRESAERLADAEMCLANQQTHLQNSEHKVAKLEEALRALQQQLQGKLIQRLTALLLLSVVYWKDSSLLTSCERDPDGNS